MNHIYKTLFLSAFVFITFREGTTAQSLIQKAIPHYAKVQYAGGIGFISAGLGYELCHTKLQADLMYGYAPENYTGIDVHSVTAKLTWLPLSITLKKFKVNYLTAGLLINYTPGTQYHAFNPSKYSFNYYGFPTALYAGLFIGGGVTYHRINFYYEIGASDRELVTYIRNPASRPITDLPKLGLGIRVTLK